MGTPGFAASAALLLLSTTTLGAQPQGWGSGGVGITVYEDRDFRGRSATFRDDVPDLRSVGMNDRIESLRVAPGEVWEVCIDVQYRGRCQVVTADESDLRRGDWAKEISSVRRLRGGGRSARPGYPPHYPTPRPGPGRPGSGYESGLRLYDGRDFRGSNRTLNGPTPDLRALGFNDKAESLRLAPGETWDICRDIDYVGCVQVSGDAADLRRLGGLAGEISSARPARYGGGRYQGRQPAFPDRGYGGRITLYSGVRFTGRSYTVDGTADAIQMGSVQSVRVSGGNWQICEDTGFRGRCTVVDVDVPDVRSFGLPGRVRSVRPVAEPR